MPVSQQQIAQALNLSIITVSRALRDQPNLSEETKNRVFQKARELGYTKTRGRQKKNAPATKRVGVIFYDAADSKNPIFGSRVRSAIVHMLQKECQRLNAETLIETALDTEVPKLVENRAIDAAFIFGRYTAETVAKLRGLPTLAVSSYIDCPGLSRIVADNTGGSRRITEHLISLGHRKIAFIGVQPPRSQIFKDRLHGYLIAMHEHGLEQSVHIDHDHWNPADYHPPLEKLSRYTAIVCSSDSLAYLIQARLERAGYRLPDDLSIVAYDHLPEDHSTASRRITSYGPDWSLMGVMAADIMINRPYDLQDKGVIITIPGTLHAYDSAVGPKTAVT